MKLNNFQLIALEAVSRFGNFTKAAAHLRLTQPALTRRIQALESAIGSALLLRNSNGIELTQAGMKVLDFAKNIEVMEQELWAQLTDEKSSRPSGLIRIAGYSSVLHIVATPALGPLLRGFDRLQVHYQATQDIRPILRQVELVKKSEADFLIAMIDYGDREIESHLLGSLELVLIESTKHAVCRNTFLDTRPEDPSTEMFLGRQSKKLKGYQRSFLHDEEGIIAAVTEGIGQAVVFSALINKNSKVRRVDGWEPVFFPLFLHHKKRPFHSRTFLAAKDALLKCKNEFLLSPSNKA